MRNVFQPRRRKGDNQSSGAEQQTIITSLSLFIILLAFFIVLNAVTQFAKPKVDMAVGSVNTAFSRPSINTRFVGTSPQETAQEAEGQGDAMEMLQGTLRSILPNLNIVSEPTSDGGTMMAVRITKNQFENLKTSLYPLFVRLLNSYDRDGSFGLEITSYVRDATSESAVISFDVLNDYLQELEKAGIDRQRLSAVIENGNPAWLMLHFKKNAQGGNE